MINKLKLISVFVTDVHKAYEFYKNALGFEIRADREWGQGRWVEVSPAGEETTIRLFPAKDGGFQDFSDRVGVWTGFVFESDDIENTYNEMNSRGVNFIEPPTIQPWGMKQAQFTDQDGNIFVLVEKANF